MRTIEQLVADVGVFIHHLLSPETLSVVITLGGLGWRLIVVIKRNFNKEQNKMMKSINCHFDKLQKENNLAYRDMQKEILRLQILEGIDANRLSPSEVRYFYDKYKKFGGNSFVTERVHKYLSEIEKEKDNDKADS